MFYQVKLKRSLIAVYFIISQTVKKSYIVSFTFLLVPSLFLVFIFAYALLIYTYVVSRPPGLPNQVTLKFLSKAILKEMIRKNSYVNNQSKWVKSC